VSSFFLLGVVPVAITYAVEKEVKVSSKKEAPTAYVNAVWRHVTRLMG
jgi:hypothetical protein